MTYIEANHAPSRKTGQIKLHSPADFAGMRKAGRMVAECLDALVPMIRPGLPTSDIDRFVFDFATSRGALPATLMYRGYKKSTCTSINHVVCHGIPNDKPLKKGDIVNVDVTVITPEGWYGDNSRMYLIGECSIAAKRLSAITFEAMWHGILQVKPGAHLGDIGHTIQKFAEGQGFSVVREFCGHGIGRRFHEEPQVLHYGRPGTGERLEPGMIFTVEPMINAGRREVRELADGWTIVTKDHSLSAQWEHTVLVTDAGHEVLTVSAGTPARPELLRAVA